MHTRKVTRIGHRAEIATIQSFCLRPARYTSQLLIALMKPLIRLFFRSLRAVLGPFMLMFETLSRQKPVQRTPDSQAKVDQACRSLVLYHFKTCPFCIMVRKEMHRLALSIDKRDAQHDAKNKADLVVGSGDDKVPCLKITDANGQVLWLKDSSAIISYMNERFGVPT